MPVSPVNPKVASRIQSIALMECMEEHEAPDIEKVRELLFDAVLCVDEDDDGMPQGVVSGLLDAYIALLRAKAENDDKPEPETVTEVDAERMLSEASIDAVQVRHTQGNNPEFNRERVAEWFMWPQCMDYKANWPVGLLKGIGYRIGIRAERRDRQMAAYFKAHQEPEQASP